MSVDEFPAPEPPPEAEMHPRETGIHRASLAEKAAAVLFCIFCFELGLFLIVYPWLDVWGHNWWFWIRPQWQPFLSSESFRGAVMGLGFLNVLVGIRETLRLRHLR
jgi:hypothetical protein